MKRNQNIILNDSEVKDKKLILSSKIRQLSVALTNKCNISCVMCTSRRGAPWELSDRTRKEIIELLPYLEKVLWFGGEVFLYSRFWELAEEAFSNNVEQVIVTNGLLFNENIIEKLLKLNISILFSIDGTTKDVYEKIRRGADFDKLLGNLILFNKMKKSINPEIKTVLHVTVSKYNWHQIESFVGFCADYEFKGLNLVQIDNGIYNDINKELYYSDNAEALSYIEYICSNLPDKCLKSNIELNNWLLTLKQSKNTNYEDFDVSNGWLLCCLPWNSFNITSNGGSAPGCACSNTVGNVDNESIEELWNNEKMQNYRQAIISGKLSIVCSKYCVNTKKIL